MIATDNPESGGISGAAIKKVDAMTLTAAGLAIAVVDAGVFPSIPLITFSLAQNSFTTRDHYLMFNFICYFQYSSCCLNAQKVDFKSSCFKLEGWF